VAVPLAIAGGLLIAMPVQAQETAGMAAGRYTMQKTDDGFLRLDTQTGAVALCRKQSDSWGCRTISGTREEGRSAAGSAPDSSRGNDQDTTAGGPGELELLRRENAELKDEVARLEEMLGLRGPGQGERHGFKLPSEKDVDQAFDYFERMLRKFQDRLKKLEPETPQSEPRPERQL
jgi:hypothetical protein